MSRLSGIFPVIPTPFDSSGAVDPEAFARLAGFVIEAGADGCVFPGMASEVETLTPAERAGLVARLGETLGGRIAFIVGASDADPAQAAARAEEGRAAGAVAAMVMAPPGLGNDTARHAAFFSAVAAGTRVPLMLQNAPPPNGAGLPPASVAEIIKAVPAIRFVKEETLPCGQNLSALIEACGAQLDGVFGGAGARYLMDELARGAAGSMPALEFADVHARLWHAWRAGEPREARRLYSAMLPFLMFQAVFRVRATKHLLAARGLLACEGARAAGPRPDAHDLVEATALIAEAAPLFAMHPPREAAHAAA
jgi:4-hydroxy-tetrahydrodipicolinate synthase